MYVCGIISNVKEPVCVFCFESRTTDGGEGEKGGSGNFKTDDSEPLTSEIIAPL